MNECEDAFRIVWKVSSSFHHNSVIPYKALSQQTVAGHMCSGVIYLFLGYHSKHLHRSRDRRISPLIDVHHSAGHPASIHIWSTSHPAFASSISLLPINHSRSIPDARYTSSSTSSGTILPLKSVASDQSGSSKLKKVRHHLDEGQIGNRAVSG